MRHDALALGAVLLLGLSSTGCATTPGGAAQAEATVIQVENNNSLLVSVEAVSNGVDYPLGQVETGQTEAFELPDGINQALDLHVKVDPIGSAEIYLSDDVVYAPGDVIFVEVESDLDLTTVTTG